MLDGDLAREEEGAAEMRREHEVEVGVALLRDARVAGDAGDVDDAVDAAAGLEDLTDGARHVLLRGHVRGHDERRDGGLLDLRPCLLESAGVEIDHRDLGAVAREALGDGEADALGGARHDVGLSEECVLAQDRVHGSLRVLVFRGSRGRRRGVGKVSSGGP
ncbi:MAG: hypothetical protein R3E53_17755 [Myxococcota bacterium]